MLGEKYVTREALSNYVTNETFQREQKDLRTFIMQTMGVGIGACALMITVAVFFVNLSFSSNYKMLESSVKSLEGRMSVLETRMTSIETRMAALESRVGELEATTTAKFDLVFSRLSSIERRLDKIELRLDRLDGGEASAGPARRAKKK